MNDRPFSTLTALKLSIPSIILLSGTLLVTLVYTEGRSHAAVSNGVVKMALATIMSWIILAPITLVTGVCAIRYAIRTGGSPRGRAFIALLNGVGIAAALLCLVLWSLVSKVGSVNPG